MRAVHPPSRSILVTLTALAVGSRVGWATVVHPAWDFVFKDMGAYVTHAQRLIDHGLSPDRALAFQAWGTHTLLALPLWLGGEHGLVVAAVLWGLLAAAAVPMTYLLACRVCASRRTAAAVGVAALLWYPNMANAGLFLSETPLLFLLIAAVWRLVVLLQEGRGALTCGVLCALCFALRPEVGLALAGMVGVWAWVGGGRATIRQVAIVALPVVLTLLFSLWHFNRHTGRWGIAESARANLTPARCHHPWVQAFDSWDQLARGTMQKNAGRVYGVVYFYELHERGGLLRPAFGAEPRTVKGISTAAGEAVPVRVGPEGISLQFVGHRADPEIHAAIQRACVERAGWVEQIKISAVNLSGLWFFNRHWPDNTRGGAPFLPWSNAFIAIFNYGVWLPSLIGAGWALGTARRRPELALCAVPLVGLMIVAAVWFGEVRLRTPYDPLALLLALEVLAAGVGWWLSRGTGDGQKGSAVRQTCQ